MMMRTSRWSWSRRREGSSVLYLVNDSDVADTGMTGNKGRTGRMNR